MDQLTGLLAVLDQEQAITVLFAGILVFCVGAAGVSVMFRSLGKWGVFALALAAGAVVIVWRMA